MVHPLLYGIDFEINSIQYLFVNVVNDVVMGTSVSDWSQAEVASFLEDIGLGHLAPKFKDNGVNGKDLLELEDEDYRESLSCSNLQVRLSTRRID